MEQDLIRERYDLSMARIQEILTEETVPENYRDYFRKVTEFIIQCGEVLKAKEDGSLEQMTLEEGRTLNHKLYVDVLPENYETSYTNPAYAVKTPGEEDGKLLSYLYAEIRGDIIYAFEGRVLDLVIGNEALIEIYNLFEDEILPAAREIKDARRSLRSCVLPPFHHNDSVPSGLCFLTVITVNVHICRIIACFLITLSHRQFRFMHCVFQESQQVLCRCLYDSGRYRYGSHLPHLIRSAPSCGIRC